MSNQHPTEINITCAKAQCHRLYTALEASGGRGITTLEAREELNIMAPAPRVHELRWEQDKNIITQRSQEANAQGHKHSVARYILLPGSWREQQ